MHFATLRVLQNSNYISICKMLCKTLCKRFCTRFCNLSVNRVWAGHKSLPRNFLVFVCMCQQWRRLSLRYRSLADDVENNRVEDTDAVDRVRALGDRLEDWSLPVRSDASVVNIEISQVLQALGAKRRGRETYRGDTLGGNRGIPLPWQTCMVSTELPYTPICGHHTGPRSIHRQAMEEVSL